MSPNFFGDTHSLVNLVLPDTPLHQLYTNPKLKKKNHLGWLCAFKVTFTALCVRLLNEGRLDEPLLKAYSDRLEKGGDKSTTPDPNEEGMRLIDGLYVELYAAFGDFWFWKRPASITEFPKVRGIAV